MLPGRHLRKKRSQLKRIKNHRKATSLWLLPGDFFQENDVNSLADTIQKWLSQNLHSREAIRQFAYQTIDTKWNLYYQMNILKQVFLKQAKDE